MRCGEARVDRFEAMRRRSPRSGFSCSVPGASASVLMSSPNTKARPASCAASLGRDRARIGDAAGDRRRRHRVGRSEIDLRARRAHAALEVARGRRDAGDVLAERCRRSRRTCRRHWGAAWRRPPAGCRACPRARRASWSRREAGATSKPSCRPPPCGPRARAPPCAGRRAWRRCRRRYRRRRSASAGCSSPAPHWRGCAARRPAAPSAAASKR